jgi:hypothetical protein
MRKDTVLPRQKDMMESLTPEQRQSIYQKAKQVEKSARKIEALNQGPKTLQQTQDIIPTGYGMSLSAKQIQEKEQASQLETQAKKQEQLAQQKKLVKRTAQGTVKKAITTEYGTFDYEASPEESKILELGGQEANDLLVKIANYYRDEFKKQNVPIKESRKGFADFWEAGLNPESVDVQGKLRTNLEETFAPYTPLLPRLAFEKVSDILGNKSQELLQSENLAAKGAGLVASIGAGVAKDLSNPLAAFVYDTGNLYDPTATAEERGGAAFNVVTKYALPVMVPLGAAQAGIKAFKAGETVEQALSTASRALLRSSLGAVGKKIDTALYSKVPLNKLLDVLEAEGQMMGKTRVALSKELANAGKKYAKETGKAVDEFYTKYLNDYAEGKAQLTSPGRIPPPTIESLQSVETPTANPVIDEALRTADEVTNQTLTPKPATFDWSNPANEQAVRDAWYAYYRKMGFMKKNIPGYVEDKINDLKNDLKRGWNINPYATVDDIGGEPVDIRTGKKTSYLEYSDISAPTSPTQATLGQLVDETIPNQPGGAELNLLRTAETGKPTYTTKAGAKVVDETGNPVIDEALKTADEITGQATVPTQEPIIDINPTTRERYNAIADEDDAWLEQYYARKMNTRQAGFELEDYEAMARMARSFAIKYGYNNFDDALQFVARTLRERTGIDIAFTNADRQAIKDSIDRLEGKSTVATEPPISSAMQAEQPPVPPTQTATTAIPEAPQEQLTSAKNRMTQEVRDEYNMDKFDEPTRRAWEESLTNAKQKLESNSNAVDNVIAKVESKQAINETEQSVLVVALSRERRNARRLLEQTDNATTPEEIATLAEQTKIAEDRIDNYTNALNRAGSETARTLNARRAVIDAAEDLVSVRAKARQTYGKTLEAADEEAINEIGEGLENINAQIDEATGKGTTPVETAKANTRVKGIKKSAPKLQPKADAKRVKQFEAIVNRVKEKLDGFVRPSTIETMGVPTEVDIWQPRLNDPASQTYFKQLASVQNDMSKVIQKLVTDEAIEDFDTLLTRLQADGFNITDTDLKLILSADYPNTKLYDFSDIEKEYVKMVRRQLAQEAKGSSVAERSRLIRKVQDLSQKVQAGVRKTTDKTVKTIFEENIDLQNRLDDLQAQYEGYNDKLDKASQQERAVIQRQIDKIKEQITNPVLVDRIKREVPQNVQDLVHERELLRGELNDKLRELADKKFKEDHPYLNALQMAAQVPTELLVSLDNSAALTHGAFMAIRNPLKWTKATSKSFAALISEGKAKDILATVRTRDSYNDMVQAGVAGIKQRDLQDANAYASTLQKVPYVGSLFKRSNQAMEVFGAVIRADYFDALAKPHRMEYLRGKITQSELMDRYKLIAEQVNTVTGKGIKELPKPVSVIAPFANFGISRVKTATMTPVFNAIAKGDKVIAKQFAKEYFKYAASTMGLLKVAQMNGLEVGIDPSNPEYFGKIKLPGIDKWWDISGGVLEPYRILINSKPVRNVTGAEESKFKTVADFAQSKLGSIPKTGMNVALGLTGETSYGRNYDVRTDEGRLNVLLDNLPINVKISKEAIESDKSIGAKAAESSLQFIGGRLTKEKKQKVGRPDE